MVYKATSPYNRRVERRRALKRLLGRQYRSLVTKASRSTKKDFLKYDLTESGAEAIRRRLKMDPGRFCRVAEGVTVHESMFTNVQYASSPEVTSRMRGSIRPTSARIPAMLTLWESPSQEALGVLSRRQHTSCASCRHDRN